MPKLGLTLETAISELPTEVARNFEKTGELDEKYFDLTDSALDMVERTINKRISSLPAILDSIETFESAAWRFQLYNTNMITSIEGVIKYLNEREHTDECVTFTYWLTKLKENNVAIELKLQMHDNVFRSPGSMVLAESSSPTVSAAGAGAGAFPVSAWPPLTMFHPPSASIGQEVKGASPATATLPSTEAAAAEISRLASLAKGPAPAKSA
ncbi:hypothetical protein BH10PSE19_BH10PSE19_09120 [soil metagenome]